MISFQHQCTRKSDKCPTVQYQKTEAFTSITEKNFTRWAHRFQRRDLGSRASWNGPGLWCSCRYTLAEAVVIVPWHRPRYHDIVPDTWTLQMKMLSDEGHIFYPLSVMMEQACSCTAFLSLIIKTTTSPCSVSSSRWAASSGSPKELAHFLVQPPAGHFIL